MSGYWQVEMEPESREHTAFITYGGLYEFQVLPFGLTGAPSTYQRLMECVLRNLSYKICLIYLDDILVYSRTFEDHLCHLRQVFDRLRHANLKLKPSKCKFACPQVKYLDLNAAERNYSTTEREALAVIFGIKKFEPYLYGRKFILHTDHHSLKWLMSISDPSGRLARWSLLVQQYDFDIQHRPGVAHGNADALSRRPYAPPSLTISAYDAPGVQIERVRDFQRRDSDLADLIQYLESSKLPDKDSIARSLLLTIDDYFLSEDGLLFHLWTPKGRRRTTTHQQLVIPAALRYEVLTWGHDDPTAAHLGTVKTYEKLRIRYYWRNMFSDIQHWSKSCSDCAMRKTPRNRHKAPLLPIPVQDAFDRVACDIIGPFPTTKSGNRYVLIFTEYLTEWVEGFPLPSIEAARIARIFEKFYTPWCTTHPPV